VERGVKFMKLFKGGASYRSFETSGIVSINSRTVTDWRKSEQLEAWGLYKKCDKEHSEAGPWLRRLIAGLSQRKSGFALGYVHVGFSLLIIFHRVSLHCCVSSGEWTIGTLEVASQRHSRIPSIWTTKRTLYENHTLHSFRIASTTGSLKIELIWVQLHSASDLPHPNIFASCQHDPQISSAKRIWSRLKGMWHTLIKLLWISQSYHGWRTDFSVVWSEKYWVYFSH
jgi:hypothetical protein